MRSILSACVLFSTFVIGTAEAQSINVDIQSYPGAPGALPLKTFGGNANQVGTWNDWRPATEAAPLLATDGSTTTAVMSLASLSSLSYASQPPSPPFTDDLTADFVESASLDPSAGLTFTFAGLTQGAYVVHTYAGLWNCGHPNSVEIISPGSIDPPQPVQGVAVHRVTVTTGSIVVFVRVAPNACLPGYMVDCQGFQLVKLGEASAVCAGDGTGTACPCGNTGGLRRGCASSFHPLGAQLQGAGLASLSADSLVLMASDMSVASATIFQGSTATNGGSGSVFGDGLRCAGSTVVRLATRFASGGQLTYPSGGDLPLGGFVGASGAGVQRVYQVWYRDAPSFCTSATFNLTNGVRVTWAP